ncbi:hypothetical protein VC83_03384 [Pseudogymnoascus destructans]|uniref:Uncharacterized protein n=1 Tax=Pseudogymnoascus destructans TaxID=655981 RepID=A0A177AED4_9PEZI|nr:uncharacterized protein VC83_03384 [Pseudogymnoascus destructans]OAF60437.1 hypothetical protein VC83_03384 [Pseudogymnoascus destructans]
MKDAGIRHSAGRSVVCMSGYPTSTGDLPVFYNSLHISVLGTEYSALSSFAHPSHGTPVAASHFDRCCHLSKFSGEFFRVHHVSYGMPSLTREPKGWWNW